MKVYLLPVSFTPRAVTGTRGKGINYKSMDTIFYKTMEGINKNTMLLLVDFLHDNDMGALAKAVEEYYSCWDCKDLGTLTSFEGEDTRCECQLEVNV